MTVFIIDLISYLLTYYPKKLYDENNDDINLCMYMNIFIRILQVVFAIIFLTVMYKLFRLKKERSEDILNAKLLYDALRKEKGVTWA